MNRVSLIHFISEEIQVQSMKKDIKVGDRQQFYLMIASNGYNDLSGIGVDLNGDNIVAVPVLMMI